ncbi:hypothetical protein [uncultured Enterovirga sp.]|uniref:hypothetical protein n=1 Tax=uncultured Enterovirga sp. TaxID=2026352 RepID=UPI0035CA1EBA
MSGDPTEQQHATDSRTKVLTDFGESLALRMVLTVLLMTESKRHPFIGKLLQERAEIQEASLREVTGDDDAAKIIAAAYSSFINDVIPKGGEEAVEAPPPAT